jgi:hypothetical protein
MSSRDVRRRSGWGSIPSRGKRFIYSTASKPTVRLIQPHSNLEPRIFIPWIKRPELEADQSLPTSAVIKIWWSCSFPIIFVSILAIQTVMKTARQVSHDKRHNPQREILYCIQCVRTAWRYWGPFSNLRPKLPDKVSCIRCYGNAIFVSRTW